MPAAYDKPAGHNANGAVGDRAPTAPCSLPQADGIRLASGRGGSRGKRQGRWQQGGVNRIAAAPSYIFPSSNRISRMMTMVPAIPLGP